MPYMARQEITKMKYKIYRADTPIEFGRYKGKTIMEVANIDIGYLEWFIDEIDNTLFDTNLLNNDVIKTLPSVTLSILRNRELLNYECYIQRKNKCIVPYNHRKLDDYTSYDDCSDPWLDIAGTDDPDVINDVYWNLD
jgi:hypothetical protein